MLKNTLAIASLVATILVGCGKTGGSSSSTNSIPTPFEIQPPVINPEVKKTVDTATYLEIKEIINIDNIINSNNYVYEMPNDVKPNFKNCYKLDTCEILLNKNSLDKIVYNTPYVKYFLFPINLQNYIDLSRITNEQITSNELDMSTEDILKNEKINLTELISSFSGRIKDDQVYALAIIHRPTININLGDSGSIKINESFYSWYQIKPIKEEK
jgi:hypothetical protein